MSCCGQGRSQIGIRTMFETRSIGGAVIFEYVGRTALTTTGGVSGKRYRFDSPGARLTVDARDRASLDALPMLKQVD